MAIAELPPQSERQHTFKREFYCRRCGRWVFTTDATEGRVWVVCGDRSCGVRQMIFLSAFRQRIHG